MGIFISRRAKAEIEWLREQCTYLESDAALIAAKRSSFVYQELYEQRAASLAETEDELDNLKEEVARIAEECLADIPHDAGNATANLIGRRLKDALGGAKSEAARLKPKLVEVTREWNSLAGSHYNNPDRRSVIRAVDQAIAETLRRCARDVSDVILLDNPKETTD